MSLMRTNAGNILINNPWYFRNKVKNKGDWDLKNVPNGEYNRANHPEGFIFNGMHIPSDAPGNIHYGYVGSAAIWTNPTMLFEKAGEAQKAGPPGNSKPEWNVAPYYGDDPVDTIYIQYGMGLYNADNK